MLSFYVYPLGPIFGPISVGRYDLLASNTCQGLKGSVRFTKPFGLLWNMGWVRKGFLVIQKEYILLILPISL